MTHLPTGEEGEVYTNPFIVELATSARSTCGACKSGIAKSSLRLGQTVTTPDSSQHGRTFWKHLGCVTASNINSVQERLLSIEAAEGWRTLSAQNKALVLRVFARDASALAEAKEAHRVAAEAGAVEAQAAVEKKAAAAQRKADKEAAAAAAPPPALKDGPPAGGEKAAKKAKK